MVNGDAGRFVTVAVPTLNEEKHVRRCLESLLDQTDSASSEILVLDGGSTDATRAIVAEMARAHPHLRLIDNPKRVQSAAINLAATLASPRSRILVRADAHASYPKDFIRRCTDALLGSGAASTVVPMRTVGHGCFQRAVALAQNSLIGNGGARHRVGGHGGFVEHGHHAAFDLDTFRRLGGYDERFTHNEDAEFDHRLTAAGGRIFMCAEATVEYFPRERALALARQYYSHGRGRARTLLTHRARPRLRQLLPPAALVGSVGGLALGTLEPLFLAVPLAYVGVCNGVAVTQALRSRDRCILAAGFAAMIMHFSWAIGFLGMLSKAALAGSGLQAGGAAGVPLPQPAHMGGSRPSSHQLRLPEGLPDGS